MRQRERRLQLQICNLARRSFAPFPLTGSGNVQKRKTKVRNSAGIYGLGRKRKDALLARTQEDVPLVARECICPNLHRPINGYIISSPSCTLHGTGGVRSELTTATSHKEK